MALFDLNDTQTTLERGSTPCNRPVRTVARGVDVSAPVKTVKRQSLYAWPFYVQSNANPDAGQGSGQS